MNFLFRYAVWTVVLDLVASTGLLFAQQRLLSSQSVDSQLLADDLLQGFQFIAPALMLLALVFSIGGWVARMRAKPELRSRPEFWAGVVTTAVPLLFGVVVFWGLSRVAGIG